MKKEHKALMLKSYKTRTDNVLRSDAEAVFKFEKDPKRLSTAQGITSYFGKLSPKQRAFLAAFIVDNWGRV
jgi:hypothetical protein